MAIAKPASGKWRLPWLSVLLLLTGAAAALWWFYGAQLAGYGSVGSGYGAKVTCSCRYVGGRELSDCRKDLMEGMGLLILSEDKDSRSVTASFPLLDSQTATYREGFGCVLEKWEG